MSVFRLSLTKLSSVGCISLKPDAHKLNAKTILSSKVHQVLKNSVATIVGVERKDPEIDANKPKPWPWRTKKYSMAHFYLGLDRTLNRIDANSKVIVVEGNKGSGKEELAKSLAKEFGMLYIPETNLDELYINHHNFDYRTLNKYLAPLVQAVDEKMFYENPNHAGVGWMKIIFYHQRFLQYVDALAHLYNTGQGVVLERSPWSDFIFTEAMHKFGYFPDAARDYYYRIRHSSIYELQRPHLVIYLDVPADKLMERIKKRNLPHEANSKALTVDYLKELEHQYKRKYLPEIEKHSELLIYDWTNGGDLEDVVEDIERIDFDHYDPHEEKMSDWHQMWDESMWDTNRIKYTNDKMSLYQEITTVPIYDVEELSMPPDEVEHREKIYTHMVPGYDLLPSHDPSYRGFWKVLFHYRTNYREEDETSIRSPWY